MGTIHNYWNVKLIAQEVKKYKDSNRSPNLNFIFWRLVLVQVSFMHGTTELYMWTAHFCMHTAQVLAIQYIHCVFIITSSIWNFGPSRIKKNWKNNNQPTNNDQVKNHITILLTFLLLREKTMKKIRQYLFSRSKQRALCFISRHKVHYSPLDTISF